MEHPPAGPHSNFQDHPPPPIASFLQERDPLSSHNTATRYENTGREEHSERMRERRYQELDDSLCSLSLPSLCADCGA